jgi:hypothetical protein
MTLCLRRGERALMYGGVHGDDEQLVFAELCQAVEEIIATCNEDGRPLPAPSNETAPSAYPRREG